MANEEPFDVDLFKRLPVNNSEYIKKALQLSEDFKKAQEILCKQTFPNAEISYPRRRTLEITPKSFVFCNQNILFKNFLFTIVVTRKRNEIVMFYEPEVEHVLVDIQREQRQAFVGYFKEPLADTDSDRFIIFLHGNFNYKLVDYEKLEESKQVTEEVEKPTEQKKGWGFW